MKIDRRTGTLAALLPMIFFSNAVAADQSTLSSPAKGEWTLYAGQGIDSDLLGVPKQVLSGDIKWESAYFTGLGYATPAPVPAWLGQALAFIGITQPGGAVEVIGVKHRGLQHNAEADIAYVLRTGFAAIGPVRLRLGAGIGLSYAFGNPSYEDGPDDNPEKRYRLQNFNAYELEGGLQNFPETGLVFRVHHRSGMYGLIAPRHVGSNFLTVAIRQRF